MSKLRSRGLPFATEAGSTNFCSHLIVVSQTTGQSTKGRTQHDQARFPARLRFRMLVMRGWIRILHHFSGLASNRGVCI